jgi:hypothetical protein
MQYLQLQTQMITNLWRKSAFQTLMGSSRPKQQDPQTVSMLTTRFRAPVISEEELQSTLRNIPDFLKEGALGADEMDSIQLDYALLHGWYMTFLGGLQQRLNPRVAEDVARMLPPHMLHDLQRKNGMDHKGIKVLIHDQLVTVLRSIPQLNNLADIFEWAMERADSKVKLMIDERDMKEKNKKMKKDMDALKIKNEAKQKKDDEAALLKMNALNDEDDNDDEDEDDEDEAMMLALALSM